VQKKKRENHRISHFPDKWKEKKWGEKPVVAVARNINRKEKGG